MAHDYLDPGHGVAFTATIKDKDYMPFKVEIISSILAPYPVFTVYIHIPQNDMILDKIYGQELCKLNLQTKKPIQTIPIETMDFELIITNVSFPMDSKSELSENKQIDMTPVRLTMIPSEAFKTVTTFVNEVYDQPKTVKEVIEDLASNTSSSLEYNSTDQNTEKIEQIVIPPMTFYKAVQYLDNTFGLFNGVPMYYCTHDNKFIVENLSAKINSSQAFTVTQLASKMTSTEKITEKTVSPDYYYTTSTINTSWKSNSSVSVLGKTINTIVKPKDDLYRKLEFDIQEIAESNGIYTGGDVPISSILDNRTRYYTEHTGHEISESFIRSSIARKIAGFSTIIIPVEMVISTETLMKVGSPVFYDPRVSEYEDMSGKYILKASIITYEYEKEFKPVAYLHLIRTNKTKK